MDPVIDFVKGLMRETTNPALSKLEGFNALGMKGLEAADRACVEPGWYALYQKKTAELVKANDTLSEEEQKTVDDIKAEAIRYADDITILVQPSSRQADLAPLFRQGTSGGGEALKLLTQFQTSLNVIWNNIRYDIPYAVREKQIWTAIRMAASYAIAGIAVGTLTKGVFTGDDDDDDLSPVRKLIYYSMTQFTDAVPLIGDLVSTTAEKVVTGKSSSFGGDDFYPAASKVLQGAASVGAGDWGKAATRFAEGVGYGLGLPVSGAKEALRVVGVGDNDGEAGLNVPALWGRR
jgi:hypothetical protein